MPQIDRYKSIKEMHFLVIFITLITENCISGGKGGWYIWKKSGAGRVIFEGGDRRPENWISGGKRGRGSISGKNVGAGRSDF